MKTTANMVLAKVRSIYGKSKKGIVKIDFEDIFPESECGDMCGMYSCKKTVQEAMQKISAMRGVYKASIVEVDSSSYALQIVRTPCREFIVLQKWFSKHAGTTLKIDDVKYEDIWGKRSWISVNYTKCWCHNAKFCKSIYQWLVKNRATAKKVKVSFETHTYWGDRFNSYGEDMESEWYGYRQRYMKMEMFTPTGRESGKAEFWMS